MTKVLITTSGKGTRLGEITSHTNKSLVPVGDKYAICHIIDNYPNNTDFIVKIYDVNEQSITMKKLNVNYNQLPGEIRKQLQYSEIVDKLNDIGIYHGDIRHHNFGWSENDKTWKIFDFATYVLFENNEWIIVPVSLRYECDPNEYNQTYIDECYMIYETFNDFIEECIVNQCIHIK